MAEPLLWLQPERSSVEPVLRLQSERSLVEPVLGQARKRREAWWPLIVRTKQDKVSLTFCLLLQNSGICHCEERSPATTLAHARSAGEQSPTDWSKLFHKICLFNGRLLRQRALRNDMMADYKFSSLSVSTMLSLRIIAPETIMVANTIARMPSTQAAIATQGRLKAKVATPLPNW